ncbi:hypothetical protein WDU94_012802 [Cyamophila willieti]
MNLVIPSVFEHLKTKCQVLVNGLVCFKCVECLTTVENFETLKTHLKSHSAESDFVCFVCDKLLTRTNILIDHIRSVHQKIRDFSCNYCTRTFSTVYNLREHVNIHTALKKHVCEVCGQAFVHKGGLRSHKFSHGDSRFLCSICGNSYKNPIFLKRHIRDAHTKPSKSICDICGSELKSENMNKHAAVHSTERPFVCTLCGAAYKWKKHLVRHQKNCKETN